MSPWKHLPAALFLLCLVAIVLNSTLWESAAVYGGGVVLGTLAVLVLHLQERKAKPKPAADDEVARLRKDIAGLEDMLDSARQAGSTDRIAFLQPRLDEARKRLEKLTS